MSDPLLTVGYSVLGERAEGIRLPPARPDVEVLVVTQGDTPGRPPVRDDVRCVHLPGVGVARSRNHVLDLARGELVLFADDDVVFDEGGVRELLRRFAQDPDLTVALGTAVDEHGRLRKRYPRRATRLHRWNSGKAATYEMVVRRAALASAGVRFDERFGAGAEQYLGDEYILVADALRRGLVCRFFPVVVAVHPGSSSGLGFGTAHDAAQRSAVFDRVFGRQAPVARLAFVLRQPRRFGSLRLAAGFVAGRVGARR